jgi:membrane-associated phospholipid phosphatase
MKNKRKYCVLIVFELLFVINKATAQSIDLRILESINPRYPSSQFWKYDSFSAYVFTGTAIAGPLIYGFTSGNDAAKHQSYEIITGIALSTVIMEGLKVSINRTRPGDRYPGLIFPVDPAHGQSFPSGHTSLAFATATELTIQYKKWYVAVPAFLWAGSVGYSRLYLGKHYPSDVLGGAVVGAGGGLASHWINEKLFKHYYSKK